MSLRQTAILVGLYGAGMLVLTLWMPVWYDLDARVFSRLSASFPPSLSSAVALVDIRDWDPNKKLADRETVAKFLQGLVTHPQQRPLAVSVDIEFGPCPLTPCPREWDAARAQLIRGLDAATARGIKVYLAEGVETDLDDHVVALDPQDPEIYAHVDVTRPDRGESKTFRHFADTAQTHIAPLSNSAGLFYRRCYSVPMSNGFTVDVWSMMTRVQMAEAPQQAHCDTEHTSLRFGASIAPLDRDGYAVTSPPQSYSITASRPFPADADFNQRYIILGTVKYDPPPPQRILGRSGPELVAWALSGDLESGDSASNQYGFYKTHPHNGALLLFVPAFSALVVLAFTACFFVLRRLPLRGMRRFLPWIAAASALCLGVLAFAGFELWMLSQRSIQPQVTLVSFGMLFSALLCGVRGNQIEFAQLYALGDNTPVEKYDYDVFISYAHEEGAWVYEHVYVPFRDAFTADKIFFDRSSIRGGTAWQTKISLAINASRFVVPVYSEIYFRRPYCRFEINRAHRKWINAGEGSRCVLPVMRGHVRPPESVDDFQAISIDDEADVVQRYIAEIVARLAAGSPTSSG